MFYQKNLARKGLKHLDQNKMAEIFKMTFSNAFFLMKTSEFQLNFIEMCSLVL